MNIQANSSKYTIFPFPLPLKVFILIIPPMVALSGFFINFTLRYQL